MALKDYLGIIDNGLKHLFDRKAVDPAKSRRPLLRGIDRTLAQFKTGSTGTPRTASRKLRSSRPRR